ncbi:MAG: hypothetical protein MST09_06160 [Spirochaetia bacterium]|nr:hypothetical protein [Spirochaetia bacterium]
MKKLFSAFTAVLLAFCFISCAPQELSDRSSKNEGSVSLSIRSPRTISPAEGISYKDVEVWNVTFRDTTESHLTKYDDIEKTVSFIGGSGSQEIRLPVGTYDVIFEGSVTNPEKDSVVPFYGKDSVTVVGGTTVPISVFVAPKKSADGTGSFNFTVTTSGFGNNPPTTNIVDISTGRNNYFTVSLTPRGDEIPVATWTPTEISSSATTSETGDIYSFSVSSDTLELQSVPSGFYTLSIKYTWVVGEDSVGQLLTKTKEIYSPYHDFLVEIIDGLTTNGSADITVSLEDSKTYYATTGETIGNGAFKSKPKNLDELLVDINRTTISTANIYMVDSLDIDTYLEIDVSKVNATGKTYNIYTKNENQVDSLSYKITGAGEGVGEPTIDIDSSVRTVTLKNSQSSSGISGSAKIVALVIPEFVLKDNTSVFIDLTVGQYEIAETTIYMPDSTYNSYYAEHPCVTVKDSLTPLTSFTVFVEPSLSDLYSVVTTSSDDEINKTKTTYFYIMPSETAEFSVEGIPNYNLAVTKYGESVTSDQLYAGDIVKITATPEQGLFAEGTSFTWFLNGKQYGNSTTEPWCEITIGAEDNNTDTNNTIICFVKYGAGYATRKTDLNNIRDMTTLLYNNYYSMRELAYSTLGADTVDGYIISYGEFYSDDGSFPDFCIDADNNVYSIFKDTNGQYQINKTTNIDSIDYSYPSSVTNSSDTPRLIKKGNDGNLYVVNSNNQFGIVTLSADETSGASASVTSLTNPSDFGSSSEEILSFCVDSQGFIYVTYKVVSNGSTNIILSKFTNTGNVLSMDSSQSKTLFEITGTDTTITVSSGYFANLLPNNIYSNITITDMHCEGDYIYLIMRDVNYNSSEFHSLGGVCTISTDLSLPTEKKQFVGWANDSVNTTGNGIYTYKHDECFYGPQKIIAIKPKEIILADDGVSIETDDNAILNKNRVVVFNLFDNSINGSYDAPAVIEFELSTSGYYKGN